MALHGVIITWRYHFWSSHCTCIAEKYMNYSEIAFLIHFIHNHDPCKGTGQLLLYMCAGPWKVLMMRTFSPQCLALQVYTPLRTEQDWPLVHSFPALPTHTMQCPYTANRSAIANTCCNVSMQHKAWEHRVGFKPLILFWHTNVLLVYGKQIPLHLYVQYKYWLDIQEQVEYSFQPNRRFTYWAQFQILAGAKCTCTHYYDSQLHPLVINDTATCISLLRYDR